MLDFALISNIQQLLSNSLVSYIQILRSMHFVVVFPVQGGGMRLFVSLEGMAPPTREQDWRCLSQPH